MAPPTPTSNETEIPLEGFELQDIAAIEREAEERGISFDEACSQLLLEQARRIRTPRKKGLIQYLFGTRAAH
jgi:hypothetical protein